MLVAAAAPQQEYYTKFPNRYNDFIKPKLTDTQKAICDFVIRMTYGWHQTSAEISNATFAFKTGKTVQAIIKAKHQLEEMGLLVVLERGGGSKKGRYMLDLYYDDPEKSIKASIQQEEQPPEEQENIPEPLEIPATDKLTISEELQLELETLEEEESQLPQEDILELSVVSDEPQPEMEVLPVELDEAPTYEEDIAEIQPVDWAIPEELQPEKLSAEGPIEGSETQPLGSHTPEPISDSDCPVSQPEISDTVEAENPSRIEDFKSSTTKLSLPPLKEDSYSYIYNKNKQNTNPEDKEAKEERKNATAAVCSLFRSWGIELEPKDYAFIGWAFKTYGVETVNEKIQIMKLQRNRGVKFSNPLGWLRSALTRDYGFCKWDSEVVKAKERARKEAERSKLEQTQREREIQEMEKLREEGGKMKAQLAPEDREDLRKAAIEQISKMGVKSEWLNEPLIDSVENQILRERMAG